MNSYSFSILKAEGEEQEKLAAEAVAAIEKEIEPLLKDAAPFFGGSKQLTIAEVLTAPFILRLKTYVEGGLAPASLVEGTKKLPNYTKWAEQVVKQPSVQHGYDGQKIIEGTKRRLAKMKA